MVIVSVLLLFIGCSIFTSIICATFSKKEYENQCDDITAWIIDKIMLNDDYRTKEQKMIKLSEALNIKNSTTILDPIFFTLPGIPSSDKNKICKVAIFDSNGNILVESGNDLFLGDVYCINLDSSMTPAAYKDLKNYQEKMKNKEIACYSVGYHKENGMIIPDVIYLYDKKDIPLSKEAATSIAISGSTPKQFYTIGENIRSMDIFLLDFDRNFILRKKYQKLKERLDSEDFKELMRWTSSNGDIEKNNYEKGFVTPSIYKVCYKTIIDGDPCTIGILMDHSLFLDILNSNIFKVSTAIELLVCALIGTFLLISCKKLYEEEELLKQSKETFTNAVAHELKTPIAIIQNQSECILEGIHPEKTRSYVASIYEEASRMNKLVVSFLQYNRLEQIDSIQFETVSFSDIVMQEIMKYQPLLISRNIIIDNRIQEDFQILCNQKLIAMAVDNYISNAIHHGDSGSTIVLDISKDSTNYIFQVKNKCSNWTIEKENLWRIDGKSKEHSSDLQTTNLGLPITARILDLHKYNYGYTYEPESKMVTFYFSVMPKCNYILLDP